MPKPTSNPGKGNGPKNADASLTLRMVIDTNGDGLPNWGDTISFDVTAPDGWDRIHVTATQNDALVFDWRITHREGEPIAEARLASQDWPSGAAAGVAKLQFVTDNQTTDIVTLEFAVGA